MSAASASVAPPMQRLQTNLSRGCQIPAGFPHPAKQPSCLKDTMADLHSLLETECLLPCLPLPHLHTLGNAAAQLCGPLRLPVVVADHLLLQVLQLQGDRDTSGSSSASGSTTASLARSKDCSLLCLDIGSPLCTAWSPLNSRKSKVLCSQDICLFWRCGRDLVLAETEASVCTLAQAHACCCFACLPPGRTPPPA